MSWTDDVASGLEALEATPRRLRSFAWLLGGIALAIGLWVAWRRAPAPGLALAAAGAALALAGLLAPARLAPLHRAWMALALTLGWFVSRALLAVVFALLLVPTALLARLLGKRFLALGPEPGAPSYWVRRPAERAVDQRKMY